MKDYKKLILFVSLGVKKFSNIRAAEYMIQLDMKLHNYFDDTVKFIILPDPSTEKTTISQVTNVKSKDFSEVEEMIQKTIDLLQEKK